MAKGPPWGLDTWAVRYAIQQVSGGGVQRGPDAVRWPAARAFIGSNGVRHSNRRDNNIRGFYINGDRLYGWAICFRPRFFYFEPGPDSGSRSSGPRLLSG